MKLVKSVYFNGLKLHKKPTILYISGSRQHAGKTTTSLGIISNLLDIIKIDEIAYIKPLGQQLVELDNGQLVDKDIPLVQNFCKLRDIETKNLSPITIPSGFTKRYLYEKNKKEKVENYKNQISYAFKRLMKKKVIIAEGSGHPGVGSIINLSNADIATMIGAKTVFVIGGGLGSVIDLLDVDLAYYYCKQAPINGIIFNKVLPDKLDMLKELLTEKLINDKFNSFRHGWKSIFKNPIEILGFIPQVNFLSHPSMEYIYKNYKNAKAINYTNDNLLWHLTCNEIRIIGLDPSINKLMNYIGSRDIVLLASSAERSIKSILKIDKMLKDSKKDGIGGLIFTCGRTERLSNWTLRNVHKLKIPSLFVTTDTAVTEKNLLNISSGTKIQAYDTLKFDQIKTLFREYLDMDKLIKILNLS